MIKRKKKKELALAFFNLRGALPGLDIWAPQAEGLASPSVVPGLARLNALELVRKAGSTFRHDRQVVSKHTPSLRGTAPGSRRGATRRMGVTTALCSLP